MLRFQDILLSMLNVLKKEFTRFSARERIFILCAMFCGFCISAEYAIIRPVSNAIFMTAYTTAFFPWAWLAIVPLNFLVVALYNHFLPRLGCLKMALSSIAIVAGGNILFGLSIAHHSALPFIFYIWKEIYVLLMFQQLWSVIHSTIKFDQAKYLYGLIFAVGGAGGVCGSLLPGFFAVQVGSENLLFFTPLLYLALGGIYCAMLQQIPVIAASDLGEKRGSWKQGIGLIQNSKRLKFILLLVLFMQLSSTIVYYQFNTILETTIGDKDLRTEYGGRIFGIVNSVTIGLQLIGSYVLVQLFGMRLSHLMIPSFLMLNAVGGLLFPTFPVISSIYITIKAFDFSLFGILKEMLYLPLKREEKFHAKAFIDVFVYRTGKAFASFLILFCQMLQAPLSLITTFSIVIFVFWIALVWRFYAREEVPLHE